MSNFEYHLNQRFWRSKKVVQIGGRKIEAPMHWQSWKGTDIALGASPPPSTPTAHKYNHPGPPP